MMYSISLWRKVNTTIKFAYFESLEFERGPSQQLKHSLIILYLILQYLVLIYTFQMHDYDTVQCQYST